MELFDKLKELKDQLEHFVLEPERAESWVQRLAECGVRAEVEWLPRDLQEGQRGSRYCTGRLRLQDHPIDRVELLKSTNATSTESFEKTDQSITYEDHFLIDVPERGPVEDVRAKRSARRAFLFFGPKQAARWRGGRLASRLEAERELNRVLDDAGEQHIRIWHDRRRVAICVARRYTGLSTHVERGGIGGLRGAEGLDGLDCLMEYLHIAGEVDRDSHVPSKELVDAYATLARQVIAFAGLVLR